MASSADMRSYLASLDMKASIREFNPLDAPRIAQLINKSNQFNLTTRRRTEAEVLALAGEPRFVAFTVRLRDRFGDHGLIAVVIAELGPDALNIDTWLMSCRVLNRQMEEETLNEIARLAASSRRIRIRGLYLPTAKNGIVRDLYPKLGFQLEFEREGCMAYSLDARSYQPFTTEVAVVERAYDTNRRYLQASADF
jgi:FkbH-like protein